MPMSIIGRQSIIKEEEQAAEQDTQKSRLDDDAICIGESECGEIAPNCSTPRLQRAEPNKLQSNSSANVMCDSMKISVPKDLAQLSEYSKQQASNDHSDDDVEVRYGLENEPIRDIDEKINESLQ